LSKRTVSPPPKTPAPRSYTYTSNSTHTLERNPSSPQHLEYTHTPYPILYSSSLEPLAQSTPINMDRATQLSCAVAIIGLAAVAVFAIIGRAAIAVFAVVGFAAIDVLTVVGVAAIAVCAMTNGNSIVDIQHVHDTSAQADANANVTLPHESAITSNERALILHNSASQRQGVCGKVLALPLYGMGDAQQAMIANAVTALLLHGVAYTLLVGSKLAFPLELATPDGMLALPWYMRDTNTASKVSDLFRYTSLLLLILSRKTHVLLSRRRLSTIACSPTGALTLVSSKNLASLKMPMVISLHCCRLA
jgi:hypothetical protein